MLMRNRRAIHSSEELLVALADLFNEVGPDTPQEVDAVFREAGYDPSRFVDEMTDAVWTTLGESPPNRRARIAGMLKKILARIGAALPALPDAREGIVTTFAPGSPRHELSGALRCCFHWHPGSPSAADSGAPPAEGEDQGSPHPQIDGESEDADHESV